MIGPRQIRIVRGLAGKFVALNFRRRGEREAEFQLASDDGRRISRDDDAAQESIDHIYPAAWPESAR